MLKISSRDLSLKDGQLFKVPPLSVSRDKLIAIQGNHHGGHILMKHLEEHAKKSGCKVTCVGDDITLHPCLTVRETLWFLVALRAEGKCCEIDDVLSKLGLDDNKTIIADTLSMSEKKRLFMAFLLLDNHADLVLMEDPFYGLDPTHVSNVLLLMEKMKKMNSATIIFTTATPLKDAAIDERWLVTPSTDSKKMMLRMQEVSDEQLGFVDIELAETPATIIPSTSFHKKLLYLFYRDRVIDRRNVSNVFGRWLLPITLVFLESILLGGFPRFLIQWRGSGTMQDLVFFVLVENIYLLTVSMLPLLVMTQDHFQRKAAVLHEVGNGLYPKSAYLCSAVPWDQMCMIMIAICVNLVSLFPDDVFVVSFVGVAMQMLFTNLLVWLLAYFSSLPNHQTIFAVCAYVMISLVISQGFLLPYGKWLGFLQYASMIHIHVNALLQRIMSLSPHTQSQVKTMLTLLNADDTQRAFSTMSWVAVGVFLWSALPFCMTIMTIFSH